MAEYLAYRIKKGELDYDTVITARPDLKDAIDTILGV